MIVFLILLALLPFIMGATCEGSDGEGLSKKVDRKAGEFIDRLPDAIDDAAELGGHMRDGGKSLLDAAGNMP
jgi:hypothetical protein